MKTEYTAEQLMELGIRVVDNDVVQISGALYVKTPEALERVLADVAATGYEVKNLREEKRLYDDNTSIEEKEENGWSLWYASLHRGINFGKCGSCDKLVTTVGIRCHGRTCEHCGAVLYREIIEGTSVKFQFRDTPYVMFGHQPNLKAHKWDTDTGDLYLYRGMEAYCEENSAGLGLKKGDQYFISASDEEGAVWVYKGSTRFKADVEHFDENFVAEVQRDEKMLAENPDKWEAVTIAGHPLIKVKYYKNGDERRGTGDIEAYNIHGHESNSELVKVWKGKEYSEWGDFPVPESFSIYEAWHWGVKWPQSPTLHEKVLSAAGQVSRQDYYHQDGRSAFPPVVYDRMRTFIDHFTEIPVEDYDAVIGRMRRSGPGLIEDLAYFCAGKEIPKIQNHPNMWNTMNVMFGLPTGNQISRDEMAAALDGLKDPNIDGFLSHWTNNL